ncbi:peptide antibiotic transporter SbmA [Granulosicoccaceae sp. 1_MG-2023]|nr:peptide antibiotic transporter SbmA [Granulosicoccaceae sp. 1_MG-2023]
MFESFFPRPKAFILSFIVWALLCVVVYYTLGDTLAGFLSLGGLFGYDWLPAAADALAEGATPPANPGETFWLAQYLLFCYGAFVLFWMRFAPHPWGRWSVLGSAVIIFVTWFQVQLDVMINEWFGSFYNLIQEALGAPASISAGDYYGQLLTFGKIALVAITVAVFTRFFVSHWVFRWRTAINNYYMQRWQHVRHIEGASQRVQEDTMRFAGIMEGLGVSLIDSVMTLIAFLPILWGLSSHVKELPLIGEVSQALVFVAILWSVFGTALLAMAGIRLPGLEFKNQRVEAAYRKELVYGEDYADRAQPPTVKDLYNDVRINYFRLYKNYLYFNIVRYAYLQVGVLVPYIALAPTIIAGTITLGVMQQIIRAFGRVEDSFQYLVNSWTTIVELMSIYKRLKAFELAIEERPLPPIEEAVKP